MAKKPMLVRKILVLVLAATFLSSLPSTAPLHAGSPEPAEVGEITGFASTRNGTVIELTWSTECPTLGDVYIRWLTPGGGWSEGQLCRDSALTTDHHLEITAPSAEAFGMGSIIASEAEVFFEPYTFIVPADGFARHQAPAAAVGRPPATLDSATILSGGAEQEPNDTSDQANPIAPGVWTGYHFGPTDKDWYTFEAPPGTVIRVELDRDFQVIVAPFNLNLYNADLEPIIEDRLSGGGDSYSYCAYEGGTFYVCTWDEGWVGPYTLTITLTENPDSLDPDSPDHMRRLVTDGEPTIGYFQDGFDRDYFVVEVPPARVGEILELHLATAGLEDMEVEAYDFTPQYSEWGLGPLASFGDVTDHAGDYRFAATDYWDSGVDARYEATAYIAPNPDPYEPNDAIAQATPWPTQYSQLQAYMQVVDDLDFYSIELVQGQTLDAYCTEEREDAYLTCTPEIWWWTGTKWRYFIFVYTNVNFTVPFTGTYYFRIRPFVGSCIHQPYTLALEGLDLPEPPPPPPPPVLAPPVITRPLWPNLVDPRGWKVGWDYDPTPAMQAAFQVQIALDASFREVVDDSGEVIDSTTFYEPGVYECGNYYVRARIRAEQGAWSDWSVPLAVHLGLIRLGVVPATYYASGIADNRNYEFTYEISGPCTVVAEIRIGDTPYYRWNAPSQWGYNSTVWPGFLVKLPENDLRTRALLAPARRYTLRLTASGIGSVDVVDSVEAEFTVTWFEP